MKGLHIALKVDFPFGAGFLAIALNSIPETAGAAGGH
jgi:hypothetical protein